jgi:hypothetical protein
LNVPHACPSNSQHSISSTRNKVNWQMKCLSYADSVNLRKRNSKVAKHLPCVLTPSLYQPYLSYAKNCMLSFSHLKEVTELIILRFLCWILTRIKLFFSCIWTLEVFCIKQDFMGTSPIVLKIPAIAKICHVHTTTTLRQCFFIVVRGADVLVTDEGFL